MKLENERDVRSTQEKVDVLESHYRRIERGETDLNEEARKLSLVGLRRTINQMKEDIVRYQSGVMSGGVQ